jgi:hypothetical protein
VPLKGGGDQGLAVGADPGQSLRVAIETAPFQGPFMGYPVRPGPAIGVTMGGRGGGVGVGYPFRAGQFVAPLSTTTIVQLATSPKG